MSAARDILAKADYFQSLERAADTARVKIRLGAKPVMRLGLLGFLGRSDSRELFFSGEETDAIYSALGKVGMESRELARDYEARVTTVKYKPGGVV